MNDYITIALTKGRLADQTMKLLGEAGYYCEELKDKNSRKLIFVNEEQKLRFFLAKGPDVPTYVEYGVADLGIVGKDTILEENRKVYVLGIETTGPVGSVAVMNEKGTVAIRKTTEKMSHLRELTAMTEEVLKEMYIKPSNLELITVSVGPGSFTGIRIGVTTARTLSQALEIPCKGVSSIEI